MGFPAGRAVRSLELELAELLRATEADRRGVGDSTPFPLSMAADESDGVGDASRVLFAGDEGLDLRF